MRHKCPVGKLTEDEVRAKRIRKHETKRWTNSETYRSTVRAPSREIYFENIKAHLEGCYNGGHSGKNDHKEERSEHDSRRKEG